MTKTTKKQEDKEMQIGPFMNLLTDFGFKRVFGREQSIPHLIKFLNLLLFAKTDEKIESLTFLNTENLGTYIEDRKVVFDLKCITNKGETIIVEMQKAKQQYFKARSFFYGCSSITSQAVKGVWDFNLKKVYVVSLLNFELENSNELITHFDMKPRNNHGVELDYLSLSFIELPKFTKLLKDCKNELEQWIYIIRHLGNLKDAPDPLKKHTEWHDFFELANIPKKATADYRRYFKELQNEKEFDSVIRAGMEEIIEQFEEEKEKLTSEKEEERKQKEEERRQKEEVQKALISMMFEMHKTMAEIMKATKLPEAEILRLKGD